MKTLIKSAFNAIGYDIRKLNSQPNQFTIGKINYEVDPCSVGQTPQGELTGTAAIRLIRERGLSDLSMLDMCCGVGIIGLTIFSELQTDSTVKRMAFADINVFNLNSLRRTLQINQLEPLLGNQINYWLTDSLSNIPSTAKFDIIVSNPPHFFVDDFTTNALSPGRLGTYDSNWSFHKSFYRDCHNYLTPSGEVWFLENGDGAKSADLLPFIEANPNLKYVGEAVEPGDPTFFWMFTKRV